MCGYVNYPYAKTTHVMKRLSLLVVSVSLGFLACGGENNGFSVNTSGEALTASELNLNLTLPFAIGNGHTIVPPSELGPLTVGVR